MKKRINMLGVAIVSVAPHTDDLRSSLHSARSQLSCEATKRRIPMRIFLRDVERFDLPSISEVLSKLKDVDPLIVFVLPGGFISDGSFNDIRTQCNKRFTNILDCYKLSRTEEHIEFLVKYVMTMLGMLVRFSRNSTY